MSSKYNYTKEEIESKKRKMYADMDKSVAEQAREAEKVSYKTKLGLERKSTDDTTDEELLASIKAGLDQKYGDLAKKATEDAEKKRYSFSEMIKKAQEEAEKKTAEAEKMYENAINAVENDALKRGVARSTIASEGVAGLEKGKAEAVGEIKKNAYAEQADIEKQMRELSEKLSALMAEYEKSRSIEQTQSFDKAKKERDAHNEAVLEYNNAVAKQENEYADKMFEKEGDDGTKRIAQTYAIGRMNDVVEFYRSFADKNAAVNDFLSDEKWKDYLGDYYAIALRLLLNEQNQ